MRLGWIVGTIFILSLSWGLTSPSLAQDKPFNAVDKTAALKLSEKQVVMLIQTLSAIECRNVATLLTCQDAIELIKDIKAQWKEQNK